MRKLIVHMQMVLMAALVLHWFAIPAGAILINNATGIASPQATITFSEFGVPADTVITTQYAGLGVTFSPNLYQNPQFFPDFNIDPSPDSLSNFQFIGGGPIVVPFSIFFSAVQTDAAFAMITNQNSTLFQSLLGGVVVDSGVLSTGNGSPTNFYGFTGVSFDEIRVAVGGDGNMILDNLQLGSTGTVPEPASLLLLGFGLIGLAVSKMRKQN
jgi:hypothetical protein